ncbi:hypothetical protein [Nocardia wallacei]|uniref:hypothetical protein n=1 Tax=Nocardia wallacei TaxID=480035 RepID=UPI0024556588|nr:hypothetical protein [Nocardia wallacei]
MLRPIPSTRTGTCAVAELDPAYGAHFPGSRQEAFGADVEKRYRWLFRLEAPQPSTTVDELLRFANADRRRTSDQRGEQRQDMFGIIRGADSTEHVGGPRYRGR